MNFRGKLSLRRTEATERAVGRGIGHRHAPIDADVVAAIRAGRVEDSARQDDRRERAVGAAVQEHVDLHRGQPSVSGDSRPMPDHSGMTLGRGQHVFDPVVDDLDRALALPGQNRRMAGDHRRIFLLAAEAASRLRLHDADFLRWEPQDHHQRPVDVVRALERAVNRHPAVFGNGDDPVALDVELLLVATAVLPFDDSIRLFETAGDVPLLDGDSLEGFAGAGGIEDGRAPAILDRVAGLEQSFLVFVGGEQDRFGDVPDLFFSEKGLVRLDQRDDVSPRHVPEVRGEKTDGVELRADRDNLAARDRGTDRRPVQHSRKGEVVDVPGGAGDLRRALLAGDVPADGFQWRATSGG